MQAVISPFTADVHLRETVEVLRRVRASDPTYPPQRDVSGSPLSFTSWLLETAALGRWVAVVNGAVAGHVMLSTPHDYLVNHVAHDRGQEPLGDRIAEIGKFFVDPLHQRSGIGEALLAKARTFSWELGLQPSLAVVTTSERAIALYDRAGLRRWGSFLGVHGENLVFVDDDHGCNSVAKSRSRGEIAPLS